MKKLENLFESLFFSSRWLLVPFYFGLTMALIVLLVKFSQKFWYFLLHFLDLSQTEVILAILSLVDISLVANLLIIVVFSGYENFVSKMDSIDKEEKPSWMGKVDYGGLKIKLLTSIIAISAIELLKVFLNIKEYTSEQMAWSVGIHLTFVTSGVMMAWMDRLQDNQKH